MKSQCLKLGECVQIINGFAFDSERFTAERKGFPLARIRDVVRGYSETYYIGDYPDSVVIQNGDLLIGMDGEFNVGEWKGGTGLLNQRVCKIVPIDGLAELRFIKYLLPTLLQRIEDETPFVTVKHLSSEDLKEEVIALPSPAEQKRIAGILDQADRLRRIRRYALELGNGLLPAAFLKLFGDPASNSHGYPLNKLGCLFPRKRDGVKCGPFGTALKKGEYVSEGIPVWTIDNIGQNEFSEEGCLYITPAKYKELSTYSVQNDDILVSRAGTVGKMAIVRTRHEQSIIQSNLIRVSLDREEMLPVYFTTLMTCFGARVGRLKRGQEDAYTFMSTGGLADLVIPVPPKQRQKEFADLVTQHERVRAVHREALRQAEHLFQTLLHRAFTTGL